MSTAKVIFTYKRKRLSSHSGVGHEDVCAEFSLDDQVDKLQEASNKKIRMPEKDLMLACCGEKMPTACSSDGFENSSKLEEKYEVQKSDSSVENKVHFSNEFSEDDTFKTSGNNISTGASVEENTSSIEKDSRLQHSSCLNEGCMQSVFQPAEKDSNSILKQEVLSKTEVVRGQSSAPLLTFTRRMKRKAEACDTGMFTKIPLGEGDAAIRKCDSGPALSFTCEGMSKGNRQVENYPGIKVEIIDVDMGNMLCQSTEKVADNEIGDPSCGISCAETLTLTQTQVESNSSEDLVVDALPITKQTTVRTSGSIASALHHLDTIENSGLCKDAVWCPSYDATVASCNVACKTDEQPVSQHLRASSGDSQLTSSDSSDLKIGVAKRVEHGARSYSFDPSHPPPGSFVIDCNVVPESDVQEDASDIIQDSLMAKKNEKVMQEGHRESKGLELFGDDSIQVENSHDGVHTSIKTENRPETNYLQLFSEDEKCGQSTSSNTFSEHGHIKSRHSVSFTVDKQGHKVEQSASKASDALGLSLPMQLMNEGQTSKDGPSIHQFQNPSVRTCNLIQNPVVHSSPNQKSFRRKHLLENINSRATSLRGNRNISLDKFEPCPGIWSEEELDSLWIGIRRHGRGNWHAMLLDPRLRFAPWRAAGDLEDQWEREQNRLFGGQRMPSSRYLKPQNPYMVHCPGPVIWHGTGGRRVNVTTETQLSLGDVYAQKDGVTFRSAQSYGITHAQRHVTMASCSASSYGYGAFNNVQASVMIGGERPPDGPAMASCMNSCLPHWLRDPFNTPSRPLDPFLPPISTLPQMGGIQLVHAYPETSATSFRGKNIINTDLPGVHPPSHSHYGNPSPRKPGTADNLIVIDSDASSEETISDDNNNVRS